MRCQSMWDTVSGIALRKQKATLKLLTHVKAFFENKTRSALAC
jgi:hypothetical protein